MLSTVVGPVAFLFYWPISFLDSSPTILILAGSALNLATMTIAVTWLLQRHAAGSPLLWILGIIALQVSIQAPSLRASLYCIHSDAPALAMLTAGVLLLCAPSTTLTWPRAMAVSLFLWLAAWSKHSVLPAHAVILYLLVMYEGWRPAIRLGGALAAVGVLLSAAFVATLGFRELWGNMIQVPIRHPWLQMSLSTGEVFSHLHAVSPVAKVKVLVAAMLQIVRSNWPLFAIAATVTVSSALQRRSSGPPWPRRPWVWFLVLAFAMLPTAAVGRVKLGGEVNHESFSVFFLVLGLIAWIADTGASREPTRLIRAVSVCTMLFAITLPRAWEYPGWRAAWDNQNEGAYLFNRAHPGAVYFPWNPLTSILVEKKVYHFDYGVFDRNLGGMTVRAPHLQSALPSANPVIATTTAHHDHILHRYFSNYVRLRDNHDLPGWKLFGPPSLREVP